MSKTTDMVFAIYGHDKTASKALKGVGKEANNASDQFKKMGKVAAASFLAAGAAAVGFALSAAKAAAQDEKSQKALAQSIKNTAKATDAQVKSTEDFITKMQLTYGVADDKLRPAFAILTRSTGNLTDSQNLMQVAMDVSSGTGKDLSAVSLALAKAHNGNIGALTRLGVPLDKSIIKSKDFNKALQVLTTTFQGSAKAGADTFAGRMAIVQQHVNEAKEQIGYALMPTLETMATYLTDTVVPNVQAFVDGLTGVKNSGGDAMTSVYNLGEKVRGFIDYLSTHQKIVESFAFAVASVFTIGKVSAMISAIGMVINAFKALRTTAAVTAVVEAFATDGVTVAPGLVAASAVAAGLGVAGLSIASFASSTSGKYKSKTGSLGSDIGHGYHGGRGGHRAVGGSVMRGASYMVGENGPEIFTPSTSGAITPHGLGGSGGMSVVINVQGSVVHERDLAVSVRDHIAQLMRRRGLNPNILGV